jgi:hypothetical protein
MVFIVAGAYGKAIVHRRLNSGSTMDTICSECNAPTSWDQGTGADTTPSRFHSSSRNIWVKTEVKTMKSKLLSL